MSNPTLELHLRAEGVDQVKNLTAALKALNGEVGNLGQAKTALAQLAEISSSLNAMRTELKQSVGEIRDVLSKGFAGALQGANKAAVKGMSDVSKTFDESMKKLTDTISKRNEEIAKRTTELNASVTAKMAEGGLRAGEAYADGVQKSVSKVRISFPAVALPNGAKASYSVMGMDNLAAGRAALEELRRNVSAQQVIREQEATMMNQAVMQFRAIMAERLAAELAFQDKQKAQFLTYRAALAERLDAEQFMMQGAVLKFRTIQDEKVATQLAAEAKQKEVWYAHTAALEERMAAEQFMMAEAVVKYRQVQEAQLVAQLAAEAKQKELWVAHTVALKERLQAEQTMMDAAVVKFRQIEDAKITAQIASEARQKETWVAHLAAERARMAEEAAMMDQAVRQFQKYQAEIAAAKVRGSVGQAMSTGAISGSYSSIGSNYGALITPSAASTPSGIGPLSEFSKNAPDATSKLSKLTEALGGWTKNANDAHSATRGLASGFNAMWLTWGNVLPLIAGAALSHAAVDIAKMGSAVEQEMSTIRVLSEEGALAVGGLNAQLLDMARNGPFGPLEIAKAMKTLSLAGLEAAAVSSSIKDVLNFAVAGTTSIEKAADVMTTVGVAFKIGAEGYNYIGDVISKTAAVSKASVESIGEAFKTASVINQQYGASLTDVGTGLALLNNAGIQGTAAGTALRNMYVDILGRTPKVGKALQALGLDANFAFDKATGKARDFVSIFSDLDRALAKVSKIDQTKALQDIFSERGGKEAVQALSAWREQVKEKGGDIQRELLIIQGKIQDSAGFMAISAAEMSLTPLNQMKSVSAALQASLTSSFDAIQPYLVAVSSRLRDVFNSEQFQETLRKLGGAVGDVTLFLVNHLDVIIQLASAYLALKVVGIISDLYAGFTGRVLAVTAAMVDEATAARMAAGANSALADSYRKKALAAEEAAAAQATTAAATTGAATATSSLAGTLGTVMLWGGRLLGFLGLAITAWQLYQFWTTKADVATDDKVSHSKALIDALRSEADRLEDVNKAKAMGITLDELKARKALDAQRTEGSAALQAAQSEAARLRQLAENTTDPETKKRRTSLADAAEARAAQVKKDDFRTTEILGTEIDAQSSRIKVASGVQAALQEAENIFRQRNIASGNNPYALGGDKTGKGKGGKGGKEIGDNDAQMLMEGYRIREAAEKQVTAQMRAVIESRHRNLLDDESVYQAKLQVLLDGSDSKRIADAQSTGEALLAEYRENIDKIRKNTKLSVDQREQALSNLKNIYVRDSEVLNEHLESLAATSARRIEDAIDNAQGAQMRAAKTSAQYWDKELANAKAQQAKYATRVNDALMSDADRARMEAIAQTTEKYADNVGLLEAAYNKAQAALKAFIEEAEKAGPPTDGQAQVMEGMRKATDIAKGALDNGRTKVQQIAGVAGDAAFKQEQSKQIEEVRKEADKMAKDVSSHLADALLAGGKNGFKSLRDWVKNYFLMEPIKVLLQGVFQPIGNAVANFVYGGLAGQGGAGGGTAGVLGSIGSSAMGGGSGLGGNLISSGLQNYAKQYFTGPGTIGDGVATMFGGGSGIAGAGTTAAEIAATSSSTTEAMLAMGATAEEATTAGAALAGTMTEASAATTAMSAGLAAVPVVGWVALGAMAIYAMSSKGGGPKTDGKVGTGLISDIHNGPLDQQLKPVLDSITGQYDSIVSSLGGQKGTAQFGLAATTDPQGTAPSFTEAAATVNGQQVYYNLNREVGRDDASLAKAVDQTSKQALLKALQASDMKGALATWIRQLGDVTGQALDDAMKRITKAVAERTGLQDRLDKISAVLEQAMDTPAKAAARLTASRDAERAAIDETNKSLLEQVFAEEDLANALSAAQNKLATASSNLVSAYQREHDALQQNIDDTKAYAKSLRTWVTEAFSGDNSPLDATQKLGQAAQQFNDTLAAAHGGDKDARSALTGKATDYLTALKANATNAVDYATSFAQVASAMSLEATSADSSATIMQQQLDAAQAQVTALGLINDSVLSFQDAFIAYQDAKTAVDTITTQAQTSMDAYKAAVEVVNAATPAAPVSAPAPAPAAFDWSNYYANIGNNGPDPTGFASGGYHAGGWRMVGEDGPELAYTGPEQIYNTRQTQSILESAFSGGGNDDALIEEVRMLRTAVEANTNFTYRLQKDFSDLKTRGFPMVNPPDGTPLKTTAV